jgi:AcrR family transcriptional regulator
MAAKTRAVRAEDKLERRNEILDAAGRLFLERPEGLASMDELAEAAGIAKGTLYLYFPSKEEVLVALHERHFSQCFDQMEAHLAAKGRFTLEDLLAHARKQFLEHPFRMSVASLVVGLTERSLPPESALRFKMALGERLLSVGGALEHALGLQTGDGARLLNVSFALMLGMWQLKGGMGAARYRHLLEPRIAKAFVAEYPAVTVEALRVLWSAAMRRRSA